MRRTIIIGDLQGCHTEAVELLKKCKVTADDHVIFCGDMIDRGPDNDLCVDLAMKREQIQGLPAAILGNHEKKHLTYRQLELAGVNPKVRVQSHIHTRTQLRNEHYEYMERLPLYLRLPEHNAIVVHAGLFPGVPLEEQSPDHLLHIQMIDPTVGYDDSGNRVVDRKTMWPSKCPDHWRFWSHLYDGSERVIFGHTVFNKPLVTDKVVGIDGGACFGMNLHALILPEWRIVSVPATINYGNSSRGREGREIQTYVVHDDIITYS